MRLPKKKGRFFLNRAKLFAKITEKWPVKVLSLAAAVIISIFYRMSNLETRFFTVPLLIESNDALIPVNSIAGDVRVSVRGKPEEIQPILAEDIEAYIDLGRYSNEGNYKTPVQVRKKGRILGVIPLEISVLPIEIPLVLEQKVTRNVDVFPVLQGSVAQGYELTNQALIPASVVVEGPRSIFDSHIELNTETINLDRRYDNFSIMVNIINDNPLLSIHGSNMLEFRGSINRIVREERENNIAPVSETINNEPFTAPFEGGGQ
jgi:YbbR domain-containing protein